MSQKYIQETTICRVCLEPVHNFICNDCIFGDIVRWVSLRAPDRAEYLTILLKGKNESVKKMLVSDQNRTVCVSCKDEVDGIACPCCYLYEMQTLVKSVDPELARKFEADFNFDFTFHHGMAQLTLWESIHNRLMSTKEFKPILIADKRRSGDMGMCESCEVDTDELSESDGRWLCESCRDESTFVF